LATNRHVAASSKTARVCSPLVAGLADAVADALGLIALVDVERLAVMAISLRKK
jgi:hypothetical protein